VKKLAADLSMNMVYSISSFFEVQQHVAEQLFHESAMNRPEKLICSKERRPNGHTFSRLCSLRLLSAKSPCLMLIGLADQHAHTWFQRWMGPRVESLAQLFPALDYPVWTSLMVVDVYFCITTFRMKKRFARKDHRNSRDAW
jgi:hypothetical protein